MVLRIIPLVLKTRSYQRLKVILYIDLSITCLFLKQWFAHALQFKVAVYVVTYFYMYQIYDYLKTSSCVEHKRSVTNKDKIIQLNFGLY